jgi:ADP-ribosylglycohydrolase
MKNKIKGALFGLAVGDALGVPVEFKTRDYLKANPIKGMTGYGSWQQPAGTWSDDSSLAFCLAESLTKGYDLNDIANNFVQWLQEGYWGAHHKVFDVGGATRHAITMLIKGFPPTVSGCASEDDNGNGSLMRILPLLFYIKDLPINERYTKVKEVSSITHAHFRSVFSCFIYIEFSLQLLNGVDKFIAYKNTQKLVTAFAASNDFNPNEIRLFARLLGDNIKEVKESEISSTGYVLHTLEASIWCILNTEDYATAVLKAVNLGGDTDTTGCVTGGLAGLLYGYKDIYQVWVAELAREKDIESLCARLLNVITT